jgi:drug/metabolite transporter (DMT)-like permease
MTRTGWLLFVALSVVWGVPYFFIKVALGDLSPAWIAFGRVVLGALVLAAFVPRADWRKLPPHAGAIVAIAVADVALPFFLIGTGERSVSSSFTGLILSAMPIVVTLLAVAFDRREHVARKQVMGLALGITGVAALLGVNVGHDGASIRGVLLIFGATVSYSVGIFMIKRWLHDVPMLAVSAALLGVAALLLAPVALAAPPVRLPSVAAIAAVVVLGAACTALANVMNFALIAQAGAIRSSIVAYINPAVAVVLGVALLHESISAVGVAGLLLIVAGSWLSAGGPPPRRVPAAVRPSTVRRPTGA